MLWELHGKEVEAGGNSQGDQELPVRQGIPDEHSWFKAKEERQEEAELDCVS